MTWAQAVALDDVKHAEPELRRLAREYMTESQLWLDPRMHGALIYTAHRLADLADHAEARAIADPDHADVVVAFAYAGKLQLEHIQSTRRFAGNEPPSIIPRGHT